MKQLRFIVIGYGHIGKRHATLINSIDSAILAAVIDTNHTKQPLVANLNGPLFYNNIQALPAAGAPPDVAVIATPNGTHTALAMECLEAGMHVLIEKPFGLKASDCRSVLETAARLHKKVFVVKQNRFSPPVAWLKECIATGQLGEIITVEINCFWNRDQRYYNQPTGFPWRGTKDLDGGVLFTQFSHFIDILYWFFGNISVRHAYMNNLAHKGVTEFPDTGVVSFTLANGAIGSLHFTTAVWDTNMESVFTVVGEKGTVRIGGQYMDRITYFHAANQALPALEPASPPNDYGGYKGSAGNHIHVLNSIIQSLQTGNNEGIVSGEEGMQVVAIIEDMYHAAGY